MVARFRGVHASQSGAPGKGDPKRFQCRLQQYRRDQPSWNPGKPEVASLTAIISLYAFISSFRGSN